MIYLSGVILFLGLLSLWLKRPLIYLNINTGTQWNTYHDRLTEHDREMISKSIYNQSKLDRALR